MKEARPLVVTTIVTCCSASGIYVPPMMIYKRKRMKPELIDHAPAGTIGDCSDSGWIDSDLFMTFMEHFTNHIKPSKTNPVLLILVGHKRHTKNLELIDFARDHGCLLYTSPSPRDS